MNSPTPAWTEPTLIIDNNGNPTASLDAPERNEAPHTPPERHPTAPRSGSKRKAVRRYLLLILGIAVLGGATHWLWPRAHRLVTSWYATEARTANVEKIDSSPITSPPLVSDPSSDSANVSAPVSGPRLSSPETVAPSTHVSNSSIPMDLINEFAKVKVIDARLTDMLSSLERLSTDVQTLTTTDAKREEQITQLTATIRVRPAIKAAQTQSSDFHGATKPLTSVAASPTPPPSPEKREGSLELLSVDNWNGTPSVTVSRGGTISFLAPGDRTGDGVLLKNADPDTQEAVFGLPSGQTSTLHAPR